MRRILIGLLVLTSATIAGAITVNGPLKGASLESLSSDPTGVTGRVYYNSTSTLPKFYNGSWQTFAPLASPTFTGTVTAPALNLSGQTASTVPYLDASKNLVSSSVTPTTLGYLDATSSIQTQLNAKAPLASPTFTGTVTGAAANFSGNVGIGTTAPQSAIDVSGNARISPASSPSLDFQRNVALGADAGIGMINFGGKDSVGAFATGARIQGLTYGSWSDTSHGTYMTFSTTNASSTTMTERMRIDRDGSVIVAANGKFRITTSQTPASASEACTAGQIAWDASYVYVCVATNTWKRSALSTW